MALCCSPLRNRIDDQQVPINPGSVAATGADDCALEAASDVAYRRLIFVNVVYVGQPGQPDWVLVDTELPGTAGSIAGVAADEGRAFV